MSLSASPSHLLRPDRRAVTWTFLLLAFGIAVALPWSVRERAQPLTREAERETALQSIAHLEDEQRRLKEQIAALRAKLAEAQTRQTTTQATVADLKAELKAQQALAGLTPRSGPGLLLTLSDSSATTPAGTAANDYIVHDTDVRDVLNALWSAGAEALAVNGERLVVTSSVVCVGTVIIVNDTRLSPPYTITAIGDRARLAAAIDTSPQLAALRGRARELGLQLKVAPADAVVAPPYRGTFMGRHADRAGG